jgi:hypothetical protein
VGLVRPRILVSDQLACCMGCCGTLTTRWAPS